MKTEDLIADLAGRVTPARPLPRPSVRALGWLALAGACAVFGLMFFGPRADVLSRLTQADYFWLAALALMTSIVSLVTSLVLAIPGAERGPALRTIAVGLLGTWAVTMAWAVFSAGQGLPIFSDRHWPVCFVRVFVVATVPACALFVMARRGLPLRRGWTAAMTTAAAASVGALVTQLACPLDDPGHGFLGHFGPVMALVAIGLAARRLLARPEALRQE